MRMKMISEKGGAKIKSYPRNMERLGVENSERSHPLFK